MPTRRLDVYAERLKAWEEAFREFVETLCRDGRVVKAYLAGSRARGDNLPYSDYDVVVVVKPGVDKIDAAVELRRLRRRGFPLDLLVITADEALDPLYSELLRHAKPLCPEGPK